MQKKKRHAYRVIHIDLLWLMHRLYDIPGIQTFMIFLVYTDFYDIPGMHRHFW